MENKKPLYQPWNEEEFQSDVFVRGMTHIQRWMYRSLLQAAFFHTTRPFLPNDDEVLWVLAGCESQEQWENNKSKILKRFTPVEGQEGLLENKRVSKDWTRLEDKRDKMAEISEKGVEARRQKSGLPVLLSPGGDRTVTSTDTREKVKIEIEEKVKVKESSNSACILTLGEWGNLRRAYKTFFNKKPNNAIFENRYLVACKEYGEEIVLSCFQDWAGNGGKDWAERGNVMHPLNGFFKQLADMAADEKESRQEDIKTAAAREKQKQQESARANATETYVQRQKGEDWEFMTRAPALQNGASADEYIPVDQK